MRFTGINSFILACKELEKAGLKPAFNYSELRQQFKDVHTPIASLDAIFVYDDYFKQLNIIFYDKKGNLTTSLVLNKW